ncbi:MAG: hypothetical protein IJI26_08100, partial [Clostridia bacterium]|nr:hypothetical protein [Clostridia bacterium]
YDGNVHEVTGYTCNVSGLTFPGEINAYGSGTEVGMHEVVLNGVEAGVTTDNTGNYVVQTVANGLLIISNADPVTKDMTEFNGNLASYEIVVNAARDTLNGGEALTLKDTFSKNQSIDYASVNVEPEDGVSYDYSGYTGTFTIPDATKVTITYTTRVGGEADTTVSFTNTASLGKTTDGGFVGKATTVNEEEIITPTGTDIEGQGGEYTIRLYTYPEGHLEQGLGGAEFRLLDYNQKPLVYGAGTRAGEQVTFTTGEDGYVKVKLTQADDGLFIHKNTVYYLEMIKAPVEQGEGDTYVYYQKDNTLYNFLITDNPSYQYGDIYSYFNDDVLKVRCYPEAQGVNVTKRFSGNYTPSDAQKNALVFVLERENTATGVWDEVERHTYAEFSYGAMNFETGSKGWSRADYGKTYRVREENAEVEGASLKASCVVSTQSKDKTESEETNEFLVDPDNDAYSFSLVFTDEYFNHKLTIYAQDEEAGTLLAGLKFQVYTEDGQRVGDIVYETDAQGTVDIQWRDEFSTDTLYYVQQTWAPTGYLMPDEPQKIYFYFSGEEGAAPVWPEALDLTTTFGTVALSNSSDKTRLPVIVAWGRKGMGTWPEDVKKVEVQLYRAVDGGEAEAVEGMLVELKADKVFDNSKFQGLDVLDMDKKPYTYTLKETIYGTDDEDLTGNYAVSDTVSGTGWHVLRNQDAVSVKVSKAWFELDDVTPVSDTSGIADVKYDLYRTTEEITLGDGPITRDALEAFLTQKNAERVRTGSTLSYQESWERTEDALQKTDKENHPYYYFVLEDKDSMPENHVDSYVVAPADGETPRTLTVRNTKTPPTVIIRAVDKEKIYGDDDPSYSYNEEEPLKPYYSFVIEVQEEGSVATYAWDEAVQKYKVTVTTSTGVTTILDFMLTRDEGESVGSYAIRLPEDHEDQGYRMRFEDGTLTINRAKVTVTAGASKTYGQDDPALVTVEGMKRDDSADIIKFSKPEREPGEDVDSYPISVAGPEIQDNYEVEFISGNLTIIPATATVTATDMEKTYGADDPELTATVDGLQRGDEASVIEYDLAREEGEDAGSYTINVSGDEEQGNYTVVYESGTFTINPAPLTVSVGNTEKIYGDDDPVWEPVIEGLQGSDVAEDPVIVGPIIENTQIKTTYTYTLREGQTLTFSVTRQNVRDVGDYNVNIILPEVTNDVQGNYTVVPEIGKLSILPASLVITPDNLVRDVDDTQVPTLTATITGWQYDDGDGVPIPASAGTYTLKDGKTLTFTLNCEYQTKAGVYPIIAGGDRIQNNYEITLETSTLTILEMYNIDVLQQTEDNVDGDAANPTYSYEVQVDLTDTGLDSLPGFDAQGKLTFALGGDEPNQKTLRIPERAKLTVRQTSANSDYDNTITLDGEPYDEDTISCVIESVDNYYAVAFVHSRICLPLQAMAGIDRTDEGAEPVLPIAYMGIPEKEQLIDSDYAESFDFNLPTGKRYEYNDATLVFTDGAQSVEQPVASVWYEEGAWKCRQTADAEPENVPEGSVIRLYYWPTYICQIGEERFFTLNAALEYMKASDMATATIEMLVDSYAMPASDALTIPKDYEVTLAPAEGLDSATISRGFAMT